MNRDALYNERLSCRSCRAASVAGSMRTAGSMQTTGSMRTVGARTAGIMDEYLGIVTVIGLGITIVLIAGVVYLADKWA